MIPADSEIDEKTRFINLISRKKKNYKLKKPI